MPRYESPYDPSTMPTKLEHVLYEKKGHVAYVTINRPEVRNALHSYAYAELRACWRDIGLDPDIYVGIVTGKGEAFCAGRDVKSLQSCNGRLTAAECYQQSIVNKVVPREKLMATCEEMAEMICESSPLAVQAAVRLYGLTAAFPPSLVSYARQLDQEVAESEDGAEGPRAFKEKRKPVWKMR